MTEPTHHNVYELFARRFRDHPDRVFIETPDGGRWTFDDVERESARYARFLRDRGAGPGERVMVQVEKSPTALFLYLGCLRAGVAYVPLNPAYRESEVAYFAGDAEPAVAVSAPDAVARYRELADAGCGFRVYSLDANGDGTLVTESAGSPAGLDSEPRQPNDVAAILYTSGTTGRPKGAMLTHENLSSNALTLHAAWGFRPDDVLLHALPIFHLHGLFVATHCVLLNASRMVLLPRFDARRVMDLLPRATVFMGVPTFYTRLLAEPDFGREQCAGMRLFVSGSAPLLEQTFSEFEERTGHTILERYGMTETGMNTSNPLDGPRRRGTVGPPLPGVSVRVVDDRDRPLPAGDVGNLQHRGPNVLKGYWRNPEKTAEDFTADGWFRSGDLGRIDEDGYVTIVGRSKDLVISGGFNVYPKEVELYVDALEGVEESAVIGIPHPDFGEAVAAVIVRGPGGEDLTEADVVDRLKQVVAAFKVPRRVFFVDTLPRNAMGKVQKNALRKRFG